MFFADLVPAASRRAEDSLNDEKDWWVDIVTPTAATWGRPFARDWVLNEPDAMRGHKCLFLRVDLAANTA